MSEPTPAQTDFVRALQKQLRLPNFLLDQHCQTRWRRPFAELTRREVSELLDELQAWKAIPADLQRAMGQQDLPGLAL